MKRILILGGTGRTGRLAVDYALTKELEVTCLVRDPQKLQPRDRLKLVQGTPESRADIERASEGCYAIVSFLNNNRASDSPWAPQVSPPHFLATTASHCVSVMRAHEIRRIVVLSAHGVGDSLPLSPWPFRYLVEHTNLKTTFDDHAAAEAVLQASELDWSAVRAVLFAGSKVRLTKISFDGKTPKPNLLVSRNQIAVFMIDSLLHPEFYGRSFTAS